jgi:hypothetical protein
VLSFFQVGFLSSSVSVADALVVPSLQRVTVLPVAVVRRANHFTLLGRESQVGAVSGEMGVESSLLFYDMLKRLVTVQNGVILFGVVGSTQILFAFIGLDRVAHSVHVGERLGSRGAFHSRVLFRNFSWRGAVMKMFKLRLTDELV